MHYHTLEPCTLLFQCMNFLMCHTVSMFLSWHCPLHMSWSILTRVLFALFPWIVLHPSSQAAACLHHIPCPSLVEEPPLLVEGPSLLVVASCSQIELRKREFRRFQLHGWFSLVLRYLRYLSVDQNATTCFLLEMANQNWWNFAKPKTLLFFKVICHPKTPTLAQLHPLPRCVPQVDQPFMTVC